MKTLDTKKCEKRLDKLLLAAAADEEAFQIQSFIQKKERETEWQLWLELLLLETVSKQ